MEVDAGDLSIPTLQSVQPWDASTSCIFLQLCDYPGGRLVFNTCSAAAAAAMLTLRNPWVYHHLLIA